MPKTWTLWFPLVRNNSFVHASRRSPCPICGEPKDCRWSSDGQLHFCLRVQSLAQTPSGWKFIGPDKNGVFGMFVLEKDVRSTGHGRPSKTKTSEPAITSQSGAVPTGALLQLEISRRHSAYSVLLEQLTLDPTAAFWLKRRGLSIEAIAHFGLKSYNMPVLTRLGNIPEAVPGVDPSDLTKMVGKGGVLLPMKNFMGSILGFQVIPKARIACENRGGKWDKTKYLWLSSKSQGGHGPSLVEPYNSLPLGYFKPAMIKDPETLYLSEGALKSSIIAYRMGWHVLGTAAAGRFCPKQLEETFRQGGFSRVVLIPDAGMLDNAHIAKAYSATASVVESLGLRLEVLWWGQETKAVGDFDDFILSNALNERVMERIRIISYDDYYLKHSIENQERADQGRQMRKLFWLPRQKPIRTSNLPDISSERLGMAQAFEAILANPKATKGKLNLFQGPTGTGKSTTLANVVKRLHEEGRLKARVLILVKTKALMAELQPILGNIAHFAYGRSESPDEQSYCQNLEKFSAIAAARFNPGRFCQNCHEQLSFFGKTCPYKEQAKLSAGAKVVVSTYGAYLMEGSKLEPFQAVIIDEDLTSSGISEAIAINPSRDFEKIRNVVSTKPEMQALYPVQHPLWAFLHEMEQYAASGGTMPDNLIQAATSLMNAEWPPQAELDSFQFEKPSYLEDSGPRRLMVDLLEAIMDGKHRMVARQGRILFERKRSSLDVLQGKSVISLDATPLTSLLEEIWGARNIKTYGKQNLSPNVHVTQVLGKVFSSWRATESDVQQLGQVVSELVNGAENPLIVMPKGLIPGKDDSPSVHIDHPNMKAAWWGGQTRGSNDFDDCDTAILVGNFMPPPELTRLKINALRQSPCVAPQDSTLQALQPMNLAGDSWLIPYRLQPCDPDALVQKITQQAMAAEYAQAIGRLRAIHRDKLINVVILNGYILADFKIDDVLIWSDIKPGAANGPENRKRPNLESINQKRATQAFDRLVEFLRSNPHLGTNQIAEKTGLSKHTVIKYLAEAKQAACAKASQGEGWVISEQEPSDNGLDINPQSISAPCGLGPVEALQTIEAEALSLGWTPQELWSTSKRPDLKGLICLLSGNVRLGGITSEAIEIIRRESGGREVIQKFRRKLTLAKMEFTQ